jgi:hypothetical protein
MFRPPIAFHWVSGSLNLYLNVLSNVCIRDVMSAGKRARQEDCAPPPSLLLVSAYCCTTEEFNAVVVVCGRYVVWECMRVYSSECTVNRCRDNHTLSLRTNYTVAYPARVSSSLMLSVLMCAYV